MDPRLKKAYFLLLVTILLLGCASFPVAITPTSSINPIVAAPSTQPKPTDPTQVLTAKVDQNFDIVLLANATVTFSVNIE
jgi:hypothetical protein